MLALWKVRSPVPKENNQLRSERSSDELQPSAQLPPGSQHRVRQALGVLFLFLSREKGGKKITLVEHL